MVGQLTALSSCSQVNPPGQLAGSPCLMPFSVGLVQDSLSECPPRRVSPGARTRRSAPALPALSGHALFYAQELAIMPSSAATILARARFQQHQSWIIQICMKIPSQGIIPSLTIPLNSSFPKALEIWFGLPNNVCTPVPGTWWVLSKCLSRHGENSEEPTHRHDCCVKESRPP